MHGKRSREKRGERREERKKQRETTSGSWKWLFDLTMPIRELGARSDPASCLEEHLLPYSEL